MTINENGELLFKKGEIIPRLKVYKPHPTIPLKLIPKFDEQCKHRQFSGGIKPCGQVNFDWYCKLLDKGISLSICSICKENKD